MRKAVSMPMLGGILIFLVLVSFMYRSTFDYLLGKWGMDDFTYSYFIPVVVAYLIWEKRAELARVPACRSWFGLFPALLAILFYWMGELAGEYTLMFFSLWLLSVGALWSTMGRRKLGVISFPVCLALTMVPPPMVLYNGLTLQLKLISSQIGVLMLQLCGLTAYREGNVIDLGFTRLQVVDACSGLRYFFPLIILGILLAYFFKGTVWKKIVIVVSTIPISIVTNSMRIASVGILYQFMGSAAAEGFFHDFSGWFIFMISLGILLLEMAVLKRIVTERLGREQLAAPLDNTPNSPVSLQNRNPGPIRIVSLQFIIILLLMGTTAAGVQGVSERNRTAMQKPFSEFPEIVGSWDGKKQKLEQMFLDGLNLTDYLLADYRNSSGQVINSYVAFSDFQSKGKASHSPASCLPGSGWELKDSEKISLTDASGRTVIVNRAIMVMGNDRRLTYYWFDQRGRILTNLFQTKLFNIVDSITRNRTDGSMVRLITPLAENELPPAADTRLKEFFTQFNPILTSFLPPSVRL
jgi:exosortase D (VPLPA-CTERM-specific)